MRNNVFAPPASTSDEVTPSLWQTDVRFWWALAALAPLLAILGGVAITLLTAQPLVKFGGLEYVARITSLSIVRDLGPSTAASAAFLALIVWSHRLDATTLRARRARMIGRALLTSLASLPPITLVAVVAAALAARAFYGITLTSSLFTTIQTTDRTDFIAGLAVFGINMLVVGLLSYVFLALGARLRWSLLVKIVAGWVALFAIRSALSGLLSVVLTTPPSNFGLQLSKPALPLRLPQLKPSRSSTASPLASA